MKKKKGEMDMAVNSELMSGGEVASLLNVTKEAVRQIVARGELPYVPTKGGKIYRRAIVERYASERQIRRQARQVAAVAAA